MSTRMHRHTRRRNGFTLVEMLIALVVLSIGLLGAAKLFIVTLQGNAGAESRLAAVNLASDIGDRIRANRAAGAAYTAAAANNGCAVGAIGTVTCTAAQMAANDLYQWNAQIATVWPGGVATGAIVYTAPVTPALPGTYAITVSWPDQGANQTLSYVLTVQI